MRSRRSCFIARAIAPDPVPTSWILDPEGSRRATPTSRVDRGAITRASTASFIPRYSRKPRKPSAGWTLRPLVPRSSSRSQLLRPPRTYQEGVASLLLAGPEWEADPDVEFDVLVELDAISFNAGCVSHLGARLYAGDVEDQVPRPDVAAVSRADGE